MLSLSGTALFFLASDYINLSCIIIAHERILLEGTKDLPTINGRRLRVVLQSIL